RQRALFLHPLASHHRSLLPQQPPRHRAQTRTQVRSQEALLVVWSHLGRSLESLPTLPSRRSDLKFHHLHNLPTPLQRLVISKACIHTPTPSLPKLSRGSTTHLILAHSLSLHPLPPITTRPLSLTLGKRDVRVDIAARQKSKGKGRVRLRRSCLDHCFIPFMRSSHANRD
ncbi:hypothetical protein PAXRUDRAFT_658267, partial [Paxillus rubicundulus Ve08.2h10]